MGIDFFFDYVMGRNKQFIEERLRWQHLNDSITMLLRAKGYEKAPLYNESIKKFDDLDKPKKEEKTDEQIIEDTLKLFEQ